jgi:eukaryotic-like serine/threonine-protein kinase
MQPTTERAGRYHLQELIAAGGMGEVWRAVDTVLGRPVAVKLLRPEYSRDEVTLLRFRAEARHAGGLNHPGIAQVYDYEDATRDRPAYLVMELVSGPSLASVLAGGQLDARRTADVLAQAAEALHAAHAAGVLHRDIKPGNLLIGPDGQVKVTDFGIAQSSRTGNLTRTGSLVGTTGYLAPERVAGRPATVASDLYALGIVGYECLTGHPPFQGEPLQVALAHRDQDLPGLPPWCLSQPGGAGLAALIARLTAKNPGGRPATAALVAEEARRIRDGFTGPGDFPAPTRPDQAPPPAGAAPPASAGSAAPPASAGSAAPPAGAASPAPPAGAARSAPPTPARPRRHRLAAAGLAAGILAAGLLGWLLATAGSHPPQGSRAQAGRPARSAVSVRTVGVSTSLLGRPVSVVRRELRGLGLVVRVQPQPDQQAPPGSVVRIYPTGQVPAGSVVLLTAATRPAPSAVPASTPPASTPPASAPPASGTPAPSASPTTTSTTSTSPGRAKHSKGPPPGHG